MAPTSAAATFSNAPSAWVTDGRRCAYTPPESEKNMKLKANTRKVPVKRDAKAAEQEPTTRAVLRLLLLLLLVVFASALGLLLPDPAAAFIFIFTNIMVVFLVLSYEETTRTATAFAPAR